MPRDRIAAMVIVVIGVIVLGTAVGFGSEASAEPTAQGFLLDWQQQQYAAAGALTNGTPSGVATELSDAFSQLDATALFLSMDSVVEHGASAVATFTASVARLGNVVRTPSRSPRCRPGTISEGDQSTSQLPPDFVRSKLPL
jgi:hypothetical protein